jgi:hypothetical protein
MSAKNAHDLTGLIIHGTLMCDFIRTVDGPGSPADTRKGSTLAARFWSKVDRKSPSVLDALVKGRHCVTNFRHRKRVRNGYMSEARPLLKKIAAASL